MNGLMKESLVTEANISRKPAVNVLSQEKFQERARVIFQYTDEILGKSFGPYGAPTLISDYPYMEATKDGFTIARHVTYDHIAGSQLDRIIYKMIMDICGRINYAVGDGTTTAVIATNQMYTEIANVKVLSEMSSRDIIALLSRVRDAIIKELQNEVTHISDSNMTDVIRKVTYTSSNGDSEITDLITSAYEEFKYPVLRCDTADGAATYIERNRGFKCRVRIGDRMYINTKRNTCEYEHVNVLIFDHQVRERTYRDIIAPIASFIKYQKSAGMVTPVRFVCIAPAYDEVTLNVKIKQDILTEYGNTHDFSLILMGYSTSIESDRKAIYDLAMLLNTEVIDKAKEQQILAALDDMSSTAKFPVLNLVNISSSGRGIQQNPVYDKALEVVQDANSVNYLIRAGYADKIDAGVKETIFQTSVYDEEVYKKFLKEAEFTLDEVIKKFEILGTYTPDVYDARYRYTSLLMKNATIYVGGESKLSRDMRLAAVEDAVRAAESTYKEGYVLGGNISLIRAIDRAALSLEGDSPNAVLLAKACGAAFRSVYRRVFDNYGKISQSEVDCIINACVENGEVYDLRSLTYSKDVINSARTDIEILTATIDLLSILLSGNQVLISQYQHEVD